MGTLPKRTVVLMIAATIVGVILGVTLMAGGNTGVGLLLIAASLIGPPGSLLFGKKALERQQRATSGDA